MKFIANTKHKHTQAHAQTRKQTHIHSHTHYDHFDFYLNNSEAKTLDHLSSQR